MLERFRHGLQAQGFAQAVQLFIRFTEVPLFLGLWGTQLYGEWLLLTTLPACLLMADGGFTATSTRLMAMRAGGGDRPGAIAAFHTACALLAAVSAGLVIAGGVAAWTVPLGSWLAFAAMSPLDVSMVLSLLMLHAAATLHGELMKGGFWCEGRYARAMFLGAMAHVLEFAGLAAVVVLGGGPVAAAAGMLAGRLLAVAWMQVSLRRVSPWLHYGWREASLAEMRRLVAPSIASLGFPLGNALNLQGIRLVVGIALGPAAVAVFASIRTLSRVAMQVTAIIGRLLEPEMALAFGAGDSRRLRDMLRRSCQLAVWLGALMCGLLAATGERFLALWTRGEISMEWGLFVLLLAAAPVYALWQPALMVPYATNRHQRAAVFYSLVYGVAAMALAYAGVSLYGLVGAGAAVLAAEIAMALYVVPAVLTMSGEPWRAWAGAVASPPWRS